VNRKLLDLPPAVETPLRDRAGVSFIYVPAQGRFT
jgi:hypothetical protein